MRLGVERASVSMTVCAKSVRRGEREREADKARTGKDRKGEVRSEEDKARKRAILSFYLPVEFV